MPWENNESLPVAIKNTLPSEAQTIWRKAANASLEAGKDEETAVKAGWAAVQNAGWSKVGDDWKKTEKKKNAKLFDIDVEFFRVGRWNGDDYSVHDIADIAKNFEELQEVIKPPVKLGHNESSKINKPIEDGQPALGWVKSIAKKGSRLIATLTQVPELVYNAIKEGRYSTISAEIFWNYKPSNGKTYNYVLKALSLLGADLPAVDSLEDLAAYLTASDAAFEKLRVYSLEVDDEGKLKNDLKGNEDMEKKEFEDKLAKMQKKIDDLEAEGKSTKAENADLKKFKEDQAQRAKEASLEEIKTFCNELVKAGKMTPAVRDEFFKDTALLFSEEQSAFAIPFDAFKKYAGTVEALIEFDEKGKAKDKSKQVAYTNASEEVDRRANELVAAGKVKDYSLAVRQVLTDDEDLAEAYADYNKDE